MYCSSHKGLVYPELSLKVTLTARTILPIKYSVINAGLYFLLRIMNIFTTPKPRDH